MDEPRQFPGRSTRARTYAKRLCIWRWSRNAATIWQSISEAVIFTIVTRDYLDGELVASEQAVQDAYDKVIRGTGI